VTYDWGEEEPFGDGCHADLAEIAGCIPGGHSPATAKRSTADGPADVQLTSPESFSRPRESLPLALGIETLPFANDSIAIDVVRLEPGPAGSHDPPERFRASASLKLDNDSVPRHPLRRMRRVPARIQVQDVKGRVQGVTSTS
jgi:hypothetical protein